MIVGYESGATVLHRDQTGQYSALQPVARVHYRRGCFKRSFNSCAVLQLVSRGRPRWRVVTKLGWSLRRRPPLVFIVQVNLSDYSTVRTVL